MCAGESTHGHRYNRVKAPQREKQPSVWLRAASGIRGGCIFAELYINKRKQKVNYFTELHLVCTYNKTLATTEFTSNKASVGNSLISMLPLGREERTSPKKLCKTSYTFLIHFRSAEYLQVSAGKKMSETWGFHRTRGPGNAVSEKSPLPFHSASGDCC